MSTSTINTITISEAHQRLGCTHAELRGLWRSGAIRQVFVTGWAFKLDADDVERVRNERRAG